MKVREVIEAADAALDERALVKETGSAADFQRTVRDTAVVLRRYYDHITPDHAALMEAVVEAADGVFSMNRGDAEEVCNSIAEAMNALATYRRDHGLE